MQESKAKRRIPFDQPIKILLLAIHVIGFSAWFGGIVNGQSIPSFFVSLTNASGVLLVLRELYKDGWEWLAYLEGTLTIFKIILLILCSLWQSGVLLLGIVLICGLLSSHLPKEIRERRLFAATNAG